MRLKWQILIFKCFVFMFACVTMGCLGRLSGETQAHVVFVAPTRVTAVNKNWELDNQTSLAALGKELGGYQSVSFENIECIKFSSIWSVMKEINKHNHVDFSFLLNTGETMAVILYPPECHPHSDVEQMKKIQIYADGPDVSHFHGDVRNSYLELWCASNAAGSAMARILKNYHDAGGTNVFIAPY